MLVSSISIGVIPIVKIFEDFFVNGVKYAEELKIFIGTPNKEKVLGVLAAYYGRMRGGTLSWSKINGMISDIYSHDFNWRPLGEPSVSCPRGGPAIAVRSAIAVRPSVVKQKNISFYTTVLQQAISTKFQESQS